MGGGLPRKALIDAGFAWPDLLPSRASPLPPLPAFTHQKCGRGLAPEGADWSRIARSDPPPSRASPLPPSTVFTHQNVGGGLPPKALIDSGLAWPDSLPSRASPLPPLPAFTHQKMWERACPRRRLLIQDFHCLIHRLRGQARSHFWLHSHIKMWEGACPRRGPT